MPYFPNGFGGAIQPTVGSPLTAVFTPRVLDSDGAPIALARVEVFRRNALVARGTTGSDGRAEEPLLLLKNAAYMVRTYAQGYISPNPSPLTPTGDVQQDYALAPVPILTSPSVPNPEKAMVRIRTKDFTGKNLVGVPVALILDEPDETTVVVAGAFRSSRSVSDVTELHTDDMGVEDAYADLEVDHMGTLALAGLSQRYKVEAPGAIDYYIKVPPGSYNAADPALRDRT